MRCHRHLAAALFAAAAMFSLYIPAAAKTTESAKAETAFFYAKDDKEDAVLLKVLTLTELKTLSHGQANGENYYCSATDNYPTTQYAEGKGFTVGELLDYVKSKTTVPGADSLGYAGGDTLRLMATDSYGSYSRAWTAAQLYGQKRYYFEGLYDADTGWKPGWEVAGGDDSKYGLTLEDYNARYRGGDPYYVDKRATFATGVEMPVVFLTESLSGRTTSSTLEASTELGIAEYIAKNGGRVSSCLRDALTDESALRLCIPMTEADLMCAHRTAYDNFKWTYNFLLETEKANSIVSQGAVAAPEARFAVNGDTLNITLTCATPGADVYYSFDGAPQIPYTGTISYDVAGRDLNSSPVTVYMTAVREGYSDAGVLPVKYPSSGVAFRSVYTAMTGEALTLSAAATVTDAEWAAWTAASLGVAMKTPSGTGYAPLDAGTYTFNNTAKSVIFDQSLFTESGPYSFLLYARGYANKNVTVTMKRPAPALQAAEAYIYGQPLTLTFGDKNYNSGLSVYVTPSGGSRTMISASYLDRSVPGQVTIDAEYFALESTAMPGPGTYTIELANNGYSPETQSVAVTLAGSFSDVAADAWYADAVGYVTGAGLFNGTGGGAFTPGGTMTRAMFATVLHRYAGLPEPGAAEGFTDVPAGEWYSDGVAWAAAQGYVNGTGGGAYSPAAPITLEQMTTVLYRYSGAAPEGAAPDAYGEISDWALDALRWAEHMGLLDGIGGTLAAQAPATRAQVAALMMHYKELFA